MKKIPRIGDTVKVIANKPANMQSSIEHLIGKQFAVKDRCLDNNGKWDGSVAVIDAQMGQIVLQADEFSVI